MAIAACGAVERAGNAGRVRVERWMTRRIWASTKYRLHWLERWAFVACSVSAGLSATLAARLARPRPSVSRMIVKTLPIAVPRGTRCTPAAAAWLNRN